MAGVLFIVVKVDQMDLRGDQGRYRLTAGVWAARLVCTLSPRRICTKPFQSCRKSIGLGRTPPRHLGDLGRPLSNHHLQGELHFCSCCLGFREKRQRSEVSHMWLGSIVTAKKLGWCQKKPRRLFPFYYFSKSNWIFQAL